MQNGIFNNSERVINLRKLVGKNIMFLLFMSVLGASVAFAYTRFGVKPIYEVKTTYLLRSSQTIDSDAGNAATVANAELSNLTLFQKQMQTYVELAGQASLKQATVDSLGLSTEQQEEITSVSVSNTTDSQLLTITVRGTDSSLIRQYVSAFGQNFKAFSSEKFGADNLQLISDAEGKDTPVSPSLVRNVAFGGAVFLALGSVIVIFRYIRKDLIESDEEVEKVLGVPIIGAIPQTIQERQTRQKGRR